MTEGLTRFLLATGLVLLAACGGADGSHPVRAENVAPAPPPPAETAAPHPEVVLPDGRSIRVEIAADDDTRMQGLMFRESMPRGKGMLFIFPESGLYPFWMKNTLIPLDMIWINESGSIVHIARDVPPCEADPCPSYSPEATARYVLELAGGEAEYWGLRDGDRLVMRNLEHVVVR